MKINKKRFPIKAHYFFFFGAMGPLLPAFPVIGKQLGVPVLVVGAMSATFPLLYLVLKPTIGFVADRFSRQRKVIFISAVILATLSFDLLYFIQGAPERCDSLAICSEEADVYAEKCLLTCGKTNLTVYRNMSDLCLSATNASQCPIEVPNCLLECPSPPIAHYWMYVIISCLGNIWFNITNFISDAICFDVIGEGNDKKYGMQRVWGTISFGISSLFSGYLINYYSAGSSHLSYTPAFVLASAFTFFDLYFCYHLQLPKFVQSESILKDVISIVKKPRITMFLIFATFIGIVDSSIIFFLLWYVDDLAKATGQTKNLKLLHGLIIAGETLIGETIAFFLCEWALKKLGYTHCLTVGLVAYAIRLLGVAAAPTAWAVLPLECIMQGPTYALLYVSVVAYAAAITPPGASATVQGLVAGMDDGLGYSIGSLMGGVIYHYYGGKTLYFTYGILAAMCAISHHFLYCFFFKHSSQPDSSPSHQANAKEIEMDNLMKLKSSNGDSLLPIEKENDQIRDECEQNTGNK